MTPVHDATNITADATSDMQEATFQLSSVHQRPRQGQVFQNMRRLPKDVQAKIQQKYKNIPPHKLKEMEAKKRIRRFMASTEMDANVLESIKR